MLLCEDLDSEDDAELIATRINKTFAEPILLQELQLVVTVSVGIGLCRAGRGDLRPAHHPRRYGQVPGQAQRRRPPSNIDLQEALRSNQRNSLATDLRTARPTATWRSPTSASFAPRTDSSPSPKRCCGGRTQTMAQSPQ